MATTISPVTSTPITTVERTWRINVETQKGQKYAMQINREQHTMDDKGNVIGHNPNAGSYSLLFDDIQAETITVGTTTMTVAQVAGFLQAYCDQKVAALKGAVK